MTNTNNDPATLTKDAVETVLDNAMANAWDDEQMNSLQRALVLRFPTYKRTIWSMFDLAGVASNQRHEMMHSKKDVADATKSYTLLYNQAMKLFHTLPW